MKKLNALIILLIAITFLGCNSDDLVMEGDLELSINNDQLELKNTSKQSIYYFASDIDALALITWAPTISDENKVSSKSTVSIALTEVTGYSSSTEEIAVYYWGAVKKDGELVAGEVQMETILVQ